MRMINEICFVCTGNICRSPAAQYLAQRIIDERGLDIRTCSAGIAAVTDEPASENSIIACELEGVDLSPHRARQLDNSFVHTGTVFAVMTEQHSQWLRRCLGVPADMIYIIGGGIPDPYLRPLAAYKECVAAMLEALPELIDRIIADDENRPTVRMAAADDAGFICELEAQCLGTDPSLASVEEEILFEHSRVLIAQHASQRLGYVSAQITDDVLYISNLCVSPEHRKKGAASHLLYSLRELAYEYGCSEISLEVRQSNRNAIRLYSGCGFAYVGIRPKFYSAPQEDAVIMTAVLR